MRKILLQNPTAILLQNATGYCKIRQGFYYKMWQLYYKMQQLLQNATFITICDSTNPKNSKNQLIFGKISVKKSKYL